MDVEAKFREFLTVLPRELAFTDEDPGAIIDRYYAPGFEHRNDGLLLDRERLVAHVGPARKNVRAIEIDVHETLLAGDRMAARYTMRAVTRKGRTLVTEIYLFAELTADGLVRRVDGINRIPSQEPADPA